MQVVRELHGDAVGVERGALDEHQRAARRDTEQLGAVALRDDRLERLAIELLDAEGRRFEAVGVPLNYFVYMPYPNLLSRHYLVRWESSDGVFYGEEQDLWSVPLWSAHARSRARAGMP